MGKSFVITLKCLGGAKSTDYVKRKSITFLGVSCVVAKLYLNTV